MNELDKLLRGVNGKVKPVRTCPKKTKVISQTPDRVEFIFPGFLSRWFLPGTFALVGIFFLTKILIGMAFFNFWGSGRTFAIGALLVGGIAAAFFVYRAIKPRIRVIATKDQIDFGGLLFDAHHFGGMRTGYEVEVGTSGKGKQLLFTGLRLSYGPWGEELPFMVDKYHSTEYVVWMNKLIEPVVAQDVHDLKERAQAF